MDSPSIAHRRQRRRVLSCPLQLCQQPEERTLFGRIESACDNKPLARMERRQKLIDDLSRFRCDLDETLAAIVGMVEPPNETALLKRVEQRRHARRGDQQALRDNRRLERLSRSFHDGEDLTRASRELVIVSGLTVVQLDQKIPGSTDIGIALSSECAGVRKFRLKVGPDSHKRLRLGFVSQARRRRPGPSRRHGV